MKQGIYKLLHITLLVKNNSEKKTLEKTNNIGHLRILRRKFCDSVMVQSAIVF